MNGVLHVNIESINEAFVRDLKKQFGPAEVEIRVKKKPGEWLGEEQFWQIIETLDWSKNGDREAVVEPAVHILASMPIGNIHQFQDILAEKLWLLDTRAHAQVFMNQHPKGRLSADDFLYVRCAVVAEGRDFFEKVLNAPSTIPQDLTFEPLLGIASEAYRRKTGRSFVHVPACNFETYGNEKGWA